MSSTSPVGSDVPAADALPGDDPRRRLHLPLRSRSYWRAQAMVVGVPVLLVAAYAAWRASWFTPTIRWSVVGALALWLIGYQVIIAPALRYRTFWYAVSDREIDLQHGVLVITRTVVPVSRVQFLKTEHGPIADRFGVAGLAIHTAAGTVAMSALDRAEAEAVRIRVGQLAHLSDDV